MFRRPKRRRKGSFLLLFLFLVAVVAIYGGNTKISVEKYTLSYSDFPEALSGFKIAHISDLHAAEFGEGNEKLVEKIEEADPDIIAVTGDVIDEAGQLEIVRTLFTRLVEIAPTYFVSGNHEWACGEAIELFELLESVGATVLRNEFVIIEGGEESFVLAGIEDPNGYADMKTAAELMQEIEAACGDCYTLLLYHRNDRLEEFASLGFDTVLCGHAHGGIVRLPFTDGLIDPARDWFPTYTSGIYSFEGTDMLVSRGLGNVGNTFRVLNRPHLPVLTIQKG